MQQINQLQKRLLQTKKQDPDYLTVSSIRTEIRNRRKHILGSYESVFSYIDKDVSISESDVNELSHFLSLRTVFFWGNRNPEANSFCQRFYILALYALTSGNVGDESIDDVIQLAECLVRSRDIFITVLKNLLPADMISELFCFIEAFDDSYFNVIFEDAVLGAIAVLLGALADPVNT